MAILLSRIFDQNSSFQSCQKDLSVLYMAIIDFSFTKRCQLSTVVFCLTVYFGLEMDVLVFSDMIVPYIEKLTIML